MTDLTKISTYAQKCYDESNSKYDKQNYFVHIQMVVDFSMKYMGVFRKAEDARISVGGALGHDLMEETKESYNNILAVCGKEVADVVLALTDVPAKSRLMKHLLTMGKTVQNYIAILDKMYDIGANASYSKAHKSSMYQKYVAEYAYRKPIFQMALKWYEDELNQEVLAELWKELDEIHTPNLK